MLNRSKVVLSLIIIILFLLMLGSYVTSDFANISNYEPISIDNNDGNWTATWSFGNTENYTLDNITINNGNATLFSHPKCESGFTLSSKNKEIREFWISHVERCRGKTYSVRFYRFVHSLLAGR